MNTSIVDDSQDFFSSMAPSVRSTTSDTSTKASTKKIKVTQAKLSFGSSKITGSEAKENISQTYVIII